MTALTLRLAVTRASVHVSDPVLQQGHPRKGDARYIVRVFHPGTGTWIDVTDPVEHGTARTITRRERIRMALLLMGYTPAAADAAAQQPARGHGDTWHRIVREFNRAQVRRGEERRA